MKWEVSMIRRLLPAVVGLAVLAAVAPAHAQGANNYRLMTGPQGGVWVPLGGALKNIWEKAIPGLSVQTLPGAGIANVRGVTDQLAEAGYIAIAPDFLSGSATNGGGTAELGSGDAVRKAISGLKPEQITADLNAVADYGAKLPASNGKVAVSGFCWGGTQTFRHATNSKNIKAGFAFYGSGPEKEEDITRIACPVYGFYGGNDNRVNATIPKSTELMKKAGKTYEPVIYEGAGHGFMRAGEAPDASAVNKKAREEAWTRWKELLKKL